MDRFCHLVNCIGKMRFVVKIVNNKVIENFFIYLLSKVQGNRPNGLGVMAIRSWSPEMLTLWNFWTDLGSLPVLTRIEVESGFGD